MFQRIAMFILKKKKKAGKILDSALENFQSGWHTRTCFRVSPTCILWLSLRASASRTPACRKRRGQESVPFHNQHHTWTVAAPTARSSVNAEIFWHHQENFGVEWQAQNLAVGQPYVTKYQKALIYVRQLGQLIFNNIIHTWSSNIQGHRMLGTTFTY